MPLTAPRERATGPSVVVIDDSLTVLATVRASLEKLGLAVLTATDPSELVMEDLQRAAMVIVDVQMEQVFGDDVVAFLREQWQVHAPIYLYSSLPRPELERRGREAGASGVVSKVDGVAALASVVQQILSKAASPGSRSEGHD